MSLAARRYNPLAQPAAAPEPAEPALRILPAPPVTAPATPSAGVVKKVSFGAVTTKKKSSSKEYTVLENASPEVIELAKTIRLDNEQFDVLEGSLKANKAELRRLVLPDYFAVLQGSILTKDDANGLRVAEEIKDGKAVGGALLLATSKYALIEDENVLVPFLGQRVGSLFKQTFEIKIKSENLPETLDTQKFINDLCEVISRYGVTEAFEVKQGVRATKEFHASRHQLLTPEQNVALDAICAFQCQVKTKNLK